MGKLITTCISCGCSFEWDDSFLQLNKGMPDCPTCGFNNQTGRKGKIKGKGVFGKIASLFASKK